MEMVISILAAAVRSGTPILFATLGEIIIEKSGILNLGLEGIMLIGALTGFSVSLASGNPWLGIIAAFILGAFITLIHGFISITLKGNQVVSGLAMTIFGTGVSSLIGKAFIGKTIPGLLKTPFPVLNRIPFIGPIFFNHDLMVYFSFFLVVFLSWFLISTRIGLNLRAVGDSPRAADAMGLNVNRIRYLAVLIGGGIVALGGAYLSVAYNKMWTESMTAGRGWIAVALVIFAIWNPTRAALGAYLFGGVEAFQLRLQATGTSIPTPLLLMLPYLLTISVLIFISIGKGKGILFGAPASLGQPYFREESD
ncbi:MAG TPA: ABC transporter permease [Candidatus Atribacteria bacterium]|nr:ABC transporter permease [Candidatus Atribacteria bacterium]